MQQTGGADTANIAPGPTPRSDMRDRMFMTPALVVDGSELAFVGEIEPGREAEAFATLLTFATFSVKTEEVIDEAYSIECARTGAASRLSEERWYALAKEYFDEFMDNVRNGPPEVLLGHYLWLETHFFAKYRGYESLRAVIGRLLKPQAVTLH
jgi:hypothetical protein